MTAGTTTAAVVEAALDVTAIEEAVSVVLEGSIAAARPVAGGAAMGVVAVVEGDALTGVAAATEADAGPRVAAATLTDVAAIAWPSWFRDAHTLLSSQNLGAEFTALIEQFVQLEKRTAFAPGGRFEGFKSDNRPPEVRYWISRGRATEPKISAVKDFEGSWWKWWKGLQPDWRAVLEVEGVLDSAHQPTLMGNEDWSAVDKYGRNAFFSVMATLLWWGAALPGPANGDAHWMAAVRDVGWVLTGLLGAWYVGFCSGIICTDIFVQLLTSHAPETVKEA